MNAHARRSGLPRAVPKWREWPLCQLPPGLRCYVIAVTAAAAAAIAATAAASSFTSDEWIRFAVLLGCGLASVEATRRVDYSQGGLVRDLLTVWCLPVAVLLPPFFALLVPIPLLAWTQLRVHAGVIHRRVFSAAAIGLAYAAASASFRAVPAALAGPSLGTGTHVVTWGLTAALVDVLAWLIHNALIITAIRASDPAMRIADLLLEREARIADYVQWSLAVVVTIVAAASPALLVFAAPAVLMQRRFAMHAQLVSSTRMDAKTGLLNSQTWEREATAEITRAARGRAPLAVMLIDIDHFKMVNDTYGHLAGDETLRAVSTAIAVMIRDQDVAGRFGGEEFAVLLPGAGAAAAHGIAERVRAHIAALPVAAVSAGNAARIRVTVSIGVAVLTSGQRELTDLLAAADSGLYRAKNAGRNQTCLVTDTPQPERAQLRPGPGGPDPNSGRPEGSAGYEQPPGGP